MRWKENLERIMNEDYPREALESISWNEGLIVLVFEEKMKTEVRAIKNYYSQIVGNKAKEEKKKNKCMYLTFDSIYGLNVKRLYKLIVL